MKARAALLPMPVSDEEFQNKQNIFHPSVIFSSLVSACKDGQTLSALLPSFSHSCCNFSYFNWLPYKVNQLIQLVSLL